MEPHILSRITRVVDNDVDGTTGCGTIYQVDLSFQIGLKDLLDDDGADRMVAEEVRKWREGILSTLTYRQD